MVSRTTAATQKLSEMRRQPLVSVVQDSQIVLHRPRCSSTSCSICELGPGLAMAKAHPRIAQEGPGPDFWQSFETTATWARTLEPLAEAPAQPKPKPSLTGCLAAFPYRGSGLRVGEHLWQPFGQSSLPCSMKSCKAPGNGEGLLCEADPAFSSQPPLR